MWDFFQPSAAETLSHSQVVEWISGSRIQSHWPCITLCPSSMFSSTLATARAVVPASQAGGNSETSSAARPAALQAALDLHDLADVGGVALAEVGHDLVADGVELAADVVEVFGSQVFEERGAHGEESWG